jgi:hypothetical protein
MLNSFRENKTRDFDINTIAHGNGQFQAFFLFYRFFYRFFSSITSQKGTESVVAATLTSTTPPAGCRAVGFRLVEMPCHGDRADCCGADGGRIWMEEGQVSEHPCESRMQEAIAVNGVETLVVACPKDVTILL